MASDCLTYISLLCILSLIFNFLLPFHDFSEWDEWFPLPLQPCQLVRFPMLMWRMFLENIFCEGAGLHPSVFLQTGGCFLQTWKQTKCPRMFPNKLKYLNTLYFISGKTKYTPKAPLLFRYSILIWSSGSSSTGSKIVAVIACAALFSKWLFRSIFIYSKIYFYFCVHLVRTCSPRLWKQSGTGW